jgi:hypothetical protein
MRETGVALQCRSCSILVNGDRLGQKREIGVVNLPSFGKRNALSGIADVCHPKQSADRDPHRSDASPVLANMSRCAERERTKAIIRQRGASNKPFLLRWPRSTPKNIELSRERSEPSTGMHPNVRRVIAANQCQ